MNKNKMKKILLSLGFKESEHDRVFFQTKHNVIDIDMAETFILIIIIGESMSNSMLIEFNSIREIHRQDDMLFFSLGCGNMFTLYGDFQGEYDMRWKGACRK